jgi:transcriptional regulator with GAF, ATPase, and Fis domain
MVKAVVDDENDEAGQLIVKAVSHFIRDDFKQAMSFLLGGVFHAADITAMGVMIPAGATEYQFDFYQRSAGTIQHVRCYSHKSDVESFHFLKIFRESPIEKICRENGIVSYFTHTVPGGRVHVVGFSKEMKISQRQLNILQSFSLVVWHFLLQRSHQDFLSMGEANTNDDDFLSDAERETRKPLIGIVSQSDAFNKVLERVELVAPTDATVLITGESGTGKELIAHAVQHRSRRSEKPWVKLNCAALPSSLIESELFGHEKGAFTGAMAQKKGRFEVADEGTIFLDEIGELPLDLQTKLLRVLQEGEFERVGGTKTIAVDVRIVAATNRNLDDLMERKLFREDLFYRLNVFPIHSPPLRERAEDIPFLVDHFIRKYSRKFNKNVTSVPTLAIEALELFHWPGNVRELENVIERALILSTSPVLDLTEWIDAQVKPHVLKSEKKSLNEVEVEYIRSVLDSVNWRIRGDGGAASILGIKPTTLEARIKKLGIRRDIL